jgi:protein gp37
MGDLLHGGVTPTHVAACLAVAGVASRQGHDMMLLTKRPRRLLRLLRDFGPQEAADIAVRSLTQHGDLDMVHRYLLAQAGDGPWPPQGRYGVSVEDQERADQRVPALAGVQVERERRFLSVEPLLGPLDLTGHMSAVGWVAVGCETGPNRRSCDLEWIESVVDQCRAAGVRVFVKKVDLGGKGPTGEHGYPREEPPAVAAGG